MTSRDEFSRVNDGDELSDGYFNGMMNEGMNLSLLNNIRSVIDRTGVYSANSIDIFSDAYIDTTGQNNTVATGTTTATFDSDKYTTTASATSEVHHTIPADTFSATISSAIGVALVEDFETGATIQFKLLNSVSDTGWIDAGTITTFTAFSAQPTTSILRLVPTPSAPTAAYPSARGFACRAV